MDHLSSARNVSRSRIAEVEKMMRKPGELNRAF